MAFSKALLLKCLGGGSVATLAVAGGTTIYTTRDRGEKATLAPKEKATEDATQEEELTDKDLVDKAGLKCGEATGDTFTDGTVCSLKDNGSLNIQQGESKEEEITSLGADGGKLKIYRENEGGYNKKLRFTVESGDITLSKSTGNTTISSLKRYESYEVKKDGDKYFLNRKRDVEGAIETLLGLPATCKLSSGSCSSLTTEDLKKIKFHEKNENLTSSGTVTLTIAKETNTTDYPLGYKFTLGVTGGEISFSDANKIKDKKQSEFRIRQEEKAETLSLEEFWTPDSLGEKAGLDCGTSIVDGAVCNPKDDNKIGFKLEVKKTITEVTLLDGGRLKVYKNQKGYRGGLKFVIEGGDIDLGGASGSGNNKLEEFETYELEYYKGEENAKPIYISRKTEKNEGIRERLGLPESCKFPEKDNGTATCKSIDVKTINFRGRSESATGTLDLTITKVSNKPQEYPFGYKFTFKTTSGSIKVSLDNEITTGGVDFKIGRDGMDLFLERDWKIAELAKKLGLNCDESNNCCTLASPSSAKLNVKQGDKKIEDISSLTMGSGKIKLEKNKMGYGFGFKFTIEGGDITLKETDKLSQYETYEIKEEGDKWYLSRKTKAGDALGSKLGLPKKCEFPEDADKDGKTCELDLSAFSKVNFDGKGDNKVASFTKGEKITLKIKKDTSLNPGYKFIFETGQNTSATVPISAGNSAKLREGTKMEFKIKKEGEDLKLVKRYTITSFTTGNNIVPFLDDCNGDESSEQQCTLKEKISVYNDNDNYSVEATVDSNSTLSFEDGYEGYEKGFRFKTKTNSDITLTKNSSNDNYTKGDNGLKILKDKWYEIKQHEITGVTSGKKWFLFQHKD